MWHLVLCLPNQTFQFLVLSGTIESRYHNRKDYSRKTQFELHGRLVVVVPQVHSSNTPET